MPSVLKGILMPIIWLGHSSSKNNFQRKKDNKKVKQIRCDSIYCNWDIIHQRRIMFL